MRARVVLALLVIVYVILATGYAVGTPRWQNPDEPAHYNYIRHLAEGRGLPVLQMGDYDAAYLQRLKDAGFPADMPIDGLRYEGYQPPLYYVLAVPIYWATTGLALDAQVLALRLFSVLWGAFLLLATYAVARLALTSLPWRGKIALGAAAFVAFLPMHTAMTAAINNDTLAELVFTGLLGLLILRLQERVAHRRYVWFTGLLLGLALLTKVSIYQAVILVPIVELVRLLKGGRRPLARSQLLRMAGSQTPPEQGQTPPEQGQTPPEQGQTPEQGARDLRSALVVTGATLLLAALIAAPWFARNALVYGPTDLIGKGRHDAVVVGQLTTARFVAQYGWAQLARDFLVTSFRSFWGQFGWMGLVLDARVYLFLLALSLLAGVGLASFITRRWSANPAQTTATWGPQTLPEPGATRASLALLALVVSFALALYLGYNVTLLQHQGRYLFPAIAPLGVFFALGLGEVWQRRTAYVTACVLAGVLLIRVTTGLLSSGSGLFDVTLWGGGAVALLAWWRTWPTERQARWPYSICFVTLALVDAWCLLGFVIPYFH